MKNEKQTKTNQVRFSRGTRSEGKCSCALKRVSKSVSTCAQKERTRRQQPNKRWGSIEGKTLTSTLTFLCTQVVTQLAVQKTAKYLCYQVVTRYAGNAPEHYVAHVICSVFRIDFIPLEVKLFPTGVRFTMQSRKHKPKQ